MNITARFYVASVTQIGQPGYQSVVGAKTAEEVKLQAVYLLSKDDPNFSYSEATPQASVTLLITNKDAWGAFAPGATIDATFTPVA